MKNVFKKIRNPKILRVLIILALILVAVGGSWFVQMRKGRVAIDDSLVSAPITTIAPNTAGTLTQMDVYESEAVKKGDALAVVNGQTLYANTDGLIIMADTALGSSVTTQTPVVQMIHTSDMRIAGTLDENKGLSDIRVGQVVSFTVDALPGQTFWGYVDEISPSAKTTQATFSISTERPTQQFVVYARYDAAKYPAIKNGMSAKMTIFTDTN